MENSCHVLPRFVVRQCVLPLLNMYACSSGANSSLYEIAFWARTVADLRARCGTCPEVCSLNNHHGALQATATLTARLSYGCSTNIQALPFFTPSTKFQLLPSSSERHTTPCMAS